MMTQVSFNEDWLVLSDQYAAVMNTEVLPRLCETEASSTLPGFDGHPLHTVSWQAEHPVGTVLVLHGFTENTVKYSELIWSLLHNRFSVLCYDQRGHGCSWRDERITDPSVTHVERFDDYVRDLGTVCGTLLSKMPQPWFIFAHSMGGAVATCFLEENPDMFSAAVLSAPMIEPNMNGIPSPLARSVASAAVFFGRGVKKPFFLRPYSGPENFATSCATDLQRFNWYENIRVSVRLFLVCRLVIFAQDKLYHLVSFFWYICPADAFGFICPVFYHIFNRHIKAFGECP